MFDRKVIFNKKAYRAIVAETYEHVRTETGGILLGRVDQKCWYVLEVIDPGPNSIFRQDYFEYDDKYVTHLSNKISRLYREPIELLGLWHRHPGSLDSFSSTDDDTNLKFASLKEEGALSALVNLDPSFRLTVYSVQSPKESYHKPYYKKIGFQISNRKIPKNIQSLKRSEDFVKLNTINRRSKYKTPLQSETAELQKIDDKYKSRESISNGSIAEEIDFILEKIEPELSYLEKQVDYEFTLKRYNKKIFLEMNYLGDYDGYPKKVEFNFKLEKCNMLVVEINSSGMLGFPKKEKFKYTPMIISRYIQKTISF